MKMRWTLTAVSAVALALLTLNAWEPVAEAAAGAACPANAKPANLNFTLKDVNGKDVKLSSFKGKVILIDFWATWCEPCKMEIPWFEAFQTKYGARGFQAIGISVDDTVEKLKPYVAKYKMNYPVLQGLNHDDVQNAYGPLWGIPVTAIVSRDGKICAKHAGISTRQNFEQEIEALLTPFD
ncbi:MAG TPA: TlpA disulfide reductase family protein [Vicinamibacterales bacterium]|nr:TlpA disulfide reductase family protein [Vicinamibacterales bacterium]